MAKGLYVYDPEKKEFRPRDSGRPWAMEGGDALVVLDDKGRGTVVGGAPLPGSDTTPLRRRKRRAYRIQDEGQGPSGPSRAWRRIMWVLILVMTGVWLVMIFSQSREPDSPKGDRLFLFDRGDLDIPE